MNASLIFGVLTVYLIGLTVVLALLHAEGERVAAERRSAVHGGKLETDGGAVIGVDAKIGGELTTDCGLAMDHEQIETTRERQETGT